MATEVSKTEPRMPSRPADPFEAMRREMERMFERFEDGWPRWPRAVAREAGGEIVVPQLDVHDNTAEITVEAELPGVAEKDVSVTFADGVLTIKGEKRAERKEEDKDRNYYMAERSYGAFQRALRLPDSVDESQIDARFDNGVLRVVARKRPEAVKAERRIEVKKS